MVPKKEQYNQATLLNCSTDKRLMTLGYAGATRSHKGATDNKIDPLVAPIIWLNKRTSKRGFKRFTDEFEFE